MTKRDTTEIVRGGIRLPRTSPRGCGQTFIKLLSRVDPDAEHGFGFEGRVLVPGSTVTLAEICPSDFPDTPVLLEYAQVPAQGKRGHSRRESLYVLWRLEPGRDGSIWVELARARAASWEWAVDLRPLAVRALTQRPEIMPDLVAVQNRIAEALARELDALEVAHQARVLGIIHDQLACRVAATSMRLR